MKQITKILLADDDPVLCRLLPLQIGAKDFEFTTVADAKEVFSVLKNEDFDVVLLDVNLPDASGIEILSSVRQIANAPEVVMLTADKSLQTGIEAMRRGAYDYITKPANPQQVEAIIRKASEKHQLVKQNERLRAAVRRQNENAAVEPIHQSAAMQKVFSQATTVAKLATTLLITGESGVGKDILTHWIHSQSLRADLPLVAVNCGALPENLFESGFFGHEKGSFTGASAQKTGLIEAADGSTLFLDEIGEMPPAMQVKLLHFLENSTFRRVGATRDRHSDVRVIAATNKNLPEEVRAGNFRVDLFYRLNVISFHLPPLRTRREDIPGLLDLFLEKFRVEFNRPQLHFSEKARKQLENHAWQGNIRELKNSLERIIALSTDDLIDQVFGLNVQNFIQKEAGKTDETVHKTLAELEKLHILRVLSDVGGHREKAAVTLGITSRTLYRKIIEYSSED